MTNDQNLYTNNYIKNRLSWKYHTFN